MTVVFEQVLILFLFVAIGFLLGKTKLVNPEHSKLLSNLLVYVFLPCCNIKAFETNFTPRYLSENYQYVLFGVVLLAVLMVTMHFAAKPLAKSKYERYVYEYSMIVPSYGFMGYALSQSFFGDMGLLNFIMFSTPFTIYIYAVGFPMLTKRGFTLRGLLNASMISIAVGMVIGLFGIRLPYVFESVVDKGNACMAPISMLLTGLVISEFKPIEIIKRWAIYPVTLMRLVILPVAVCAIMKLFGINDDFVAIATLFSALPCGLNTVIFPKLVDEDCKDGAGLALISTVLACVTIPIIFTVFKLI